MTGGARSLRASSVPPQPTGRLQSRMVDAGPWTIHTRASLDPPAGAPVVVLVHGLVISSLYMVPAARRLAPHFRVLAPDLPGFGHSTKPPYTLDVPGLANALDAWMEALSLQGTVLVGNSLGCQIIADLAARRPHRVARAVLAGPTMDARGRTAPVQFLRWLVDWTGESPSLAPAHVRDYYKAGLERARETFRYALQDRIEDKLPLVQAPTLVVRGSGDTIVPQRWAAEVTRLLPRARLATIVGGPHCVNYSTPDAFARIVREFAGE